MLPIRYSLSFILIAGLMLHSTMQRLHFHGNQDSNDPHASAVCRCNALGCDRSESRCALTEEPSYLKEDCAFCKAMMRWMPQDLSVTLSMRPLLGLAAILWPPKPTVVFDLTWPPLRAPPTI